MIILGFPSEIGIQKALRDLFDPRFLHYAGNILAGFCTVQDFAERLARSAFVHLGDQPYLQPNVLDCRSPVGFRQPPWRSGSKVRLKG